jgi:hypothetical protein
MMRPISVDRDRILDAWSGKVNKKTVLLNVRRNSETSTSKRNGTNTATANARFGKGIPEPFPFPGSPESLRSARNPAPRSMNIPTIEARTLFQTFPHTPSTVAFKPSHTRPTPCLAFSYRSATPFPTFETHRTGWVPHHLRSGMFLPVDSPPGASPQRRSPLPPPDNFGRP